MNWRDRWRIIDTFSTDVHLVRSLVDDSKAVMKCAPEIGTGEDKQALLLKAGIAKEIIALDRLGKAGQSVPAILEHNLAEVDVREIQLYVVMEFIPGGEFGEYVKKHGVNPVRDQITQLLVVACNLGITHCDLKPKNVMMREDGTPVVIDWAGGYHAEDTPGWKAMPHQFAAGMASDFEYIEGHSGW